MRSRQHTQLKKPALFLAGFFHLCGLLMDKFTEYMFASQANQQPAWLFTISGRSD